MCVVTVTFLDSKMSLIFVWYMAQIVVSNGHCKDTSYPTQMLSFDRMNNEAYDFSCTTISSIQSSFWGCPCSFVNRRMGRCEWMVWMCLNVLGAKFYTRLEIILDDEYPSIELWHVEYTCVVFFIHLVVRRHVALLWAPLTFIYKCEHRTKDSYIKFHSWSWNTKDLIV